jgi:hypothetical protein
MGVGLRVRDPNTGAITFDTNMRVGRILGTVQAGLGMGSINDDRFLQGTPFAFVDVESSANLFDMYSTVPGTSYPRITFSGSTMTFTRQTVPNLQAATYTIYYGVR